MRSKCQFPFESFLSLSPHVGLGGLQATVSAQNGHEQTGPVRGRQEEVRAGEGIIPGLNLVRRGSDFARVLGGNLGQLVTRMDQGCEQEIEAGPVGNLERNAEVSHTGLEESARRPRSHCSNSSRESVFLYCIRYSRFVENCSACLYLLYPKLFVVFISCMQHMHVKSNSRVDWI